MATIQVEVAYAKPDVQRIITVDVDMGATVAQAIELSGIAGDFPEIDLQKNKVGIFGKLVSLDQCLQAGDRIEIYRGLLADPKQARRERAMRQQQNS